jgi:multicomponent Na+:H+ antiporter subunit D
VRDVLPGLLVALPLAGAALLPLLGTLSGRTTRVPALVLHAAILAATLGLFGSVAAGGPIRYAVGGWPGPWGIELWLDGLSTLIAVLVAGMACFASFAQTFGPDGKPGSPGTSALREGLLRGALLLLVGGLIGIVVTRDVFNLFVFLEISSLAAYTLIASGGGRATVAAFRYLLAGTAAGSLYLFGVGFLYALTGTLNMDDLAVRLPSVDAGAALTVAVVLIAVGLSIKAALFPLHGWLPDTYVYMPTPAAGFIAAVMAKVSAYALLRLLGEVLAGTAAGAVVLEITLWLGVFGVVAGGVMAVAQRAVTRMLAWSSISAMGMILIGVGMGSALAITGALFHVVAHALAKGCLFFGAGGIRSRQGGDEVGRWAGLGARAPLTLAALTIAALSMIGIPPTAGFFSKYYLLSASVAAGGAAGIAAFAAIILSSLLATVYFLRVLEAAWFRKASSPPDPASSGSPPHSGDERTAPLLPRALTLPVVGLAVLVLLTGLFARPFERHILPDRESGTARLSLSP